MGTKYRSDQGDGPVQPWPEWPFLPLKICALRDKATGIAPGCFVLTGLGLMSIYHLRRTISVTEQ